MAIAAAIYFFFRHKGMDAVAGAEGFWARHGLYALIAAAVPSLWYLPRFKSSLDDYVASLRASGQADPGRTMDLLKRLSIGGGLCELPMALGVLQLLMEGGQLRLFVGAAFITFAMRLSYRPFKR